MSNIEGKKEELQACSPPVANYEKLKNKYDWKFEWQRMKRVAWQVR